jgi:hypothetical protein
MQIDVPKLEMETGRARTAMVFLIGFPGKGKSIISNMLASRVFQILGKPLKDSDIYKHTTAKHANAYKAQPVMWIDDVFQFSKNQEVQQQELDLMFSLRTNGPQQKEAAAVEEKGLLWDHTVLAVFNGNHGIPDSGLFSSREAVLRSFDCGVWVTRLHKDFSGPDGYLDLERLVAGDGPAQVAHLNSAFTFTISKSGNRQLESGSKQLTFDGLARHIAEIVKRNVKMDSRLKEMMRACNTLPNASTSSPTQVVESVESEEDFADVVEFGNMFVEVPPDPPKPKPKGKGKEKKAWHDSIRVKKQILMSKDCKYASRKDVVERMIQMYPVAAEWEEVKDDHYWLPSATCDEFVERNILPLLDMSNPVVPPGFMSAEPVSKASQEEIRNWAERCKPEELDVMIGRYRYQLAEKLDEFHWGEFGFLERGETEPVASKGVILHPPTCCCGSCLMVPKQTRTLREHIDFVAPTATWSFGNFKEQLLYLQKLLWSPTFAPYTQIMLVVGSTVVSAAVGWVLGKAIAFLFDGLARGKDAVRVDPEVYSSAYPSSKAVSVTNLPPGKRPRPAVEKFVGVTTVQRQALFEGRFRDPLMRTLSHNIVPAMLNFPDGALGTFVMTGVCEHDFIINHHNTTMHDMTGALLSVGHPHNRTIEWEDVLYAHHEGIDLGVVRLPEYWMPNVDMRKSFLLDGDLEKLPRHCMIYTKLPHVQEGMVMDVDDCTGIRAIRYDSDDLACPDALEFNVKTTKGRCGSPYVCWDTTFGLNLRRIVGIHAAGMNGKAYAIPAFIRDIEHIRSKLPPTKGVSRAIPQLNLAVTEEVCEHMSHLNVVGRLPKNKWPHHPTGGDIAPSLLQEQLLWSVPKTGPVDLRGTKDYSPLGVAYKKLRRHSHDVPRNVRECYEEAFKLMFSEIGRVPLKRVLTWHEVVNGLGEYGIPALDRTTATGLLSDWAAGIKKCRGRTSFFTEYRKTPGEILAACDAPKPSEQDEWYYPIPELMDALNVMSEQVLRGEVPDILWKDCPKAERKVLAKVKIPRVFSFAEFVLLMVEKKFMSCLSVWMKENRIENSFLYGINPGSDEWDQLWLLLCQFVHGFDGDLKNFDASQAIVIEYLMMKYYVFPFFEHKCGYTQFDMKAIYTLAYVSTVCFHVGLDGWIYMTEGGRSSGDFSTTPFNTIFQQGNLRAYYFSVVGGFSKFKEQFYAPNYGDDFRVQTSVLELTLTGFRDFLALSGQIVDSVRKDGNLIDTKLSDTEILKRGFLPYRGMVLSPVNPNTLEEIPNWITTTAGSPRDATYVNADMYVRETFHYGREHFESAKRKMNDALALCTPRVPPVTVSWVELLVQRKAGLMQLGAAPPTVISTWSPLVRFQDRAVASVKVEAQGKLSDGVFDRMRQMNGLQIANNNLSSGTTPAQNKLEVDPDHKERLAFEDPPGVQVGLTKFEDAIGVANTDVTSETGLYRNLDPYPDQGLTQVLSRTYRVANFGWSASDSTYLPLAAIKFPGALFDVANIGSKVASFRYFRCRGVKISVRLNTNSFLFGCMFGNCIPFTDEAETVDWRLFPGVLMNSGATIISASTPLAVEMFLPWSTMTTMLNVKEYEAGYIGQFLLHVLNPLNSTNIATPDISVSVFASFLDPQVIGPDPESNVPALLVEAQSALTEASAKSSQGVLTGVPEGIQTVKAGLDTAMKIGDAIEMIGSFLNKPNSVATAERSVIAVAPDLVTGKGLDYGAKFAYSPTACISVDKGIVDQTDPHPTIGGVCRLPGFIHSSTYSSTDVTETVIASIPVSPMLCLPDGATGVFLTPMAHMALNFQYWTGGLRYRFYFNTSSFIVSRVRISWFPDVDTTVTNFEEIGGDIISRVVSVSGDTIVDFEIPWMKPTLYLPLDSPFAANMLYSNGKIVVTVVNPAISGGGATSLVYMNVFSAAGVGFNFMAPQKISNAYEFTFELPVPPQALLVTPQMNLRSDFERPFEGLVPCKNLVEHGLVNPERICDMSVATYLHRYVMTTSSNGTLQSQQALLVVGSTPWNFITPWKFWRSSLRYKVGLMKLAAASNLYRTATMQYPTTTLDGTEGNVVTVPTLNPFLEFEVPWYDVYLCRETTPGYSGITATYIRPQWGTDFVAGDTWQVYQAMGDDLSLLCYLAPPPLVDTSMSKAKVTSRSSKSVKRV